MLDNHPAARNPVKLFSSDPEFSAIKDKIVQNVNLGVYKAGMALHQRIMLDFSIDNG